MANINKAMLLGNVTRDIELRYTPKGTAVADIGLAVNRTRTDDQGNKVDEATFIEITLWGRVAEIAHQYSGKGKQLFVEGRLHLEQWQDKASGQNRQKLKVIGENIQLIGGAPGAGSAAPQSHQQHQPAHAAASTNQPEELDHDDIPF